MEKKLAISIAVLALLTLITLVALSIFLISLTNNQPVSDPSPPKNLDLPVEVKFHNQHNGWGCDLEPTENIDPAKELPETVKNTKKILKDKCSEIDGNWHCSSSAPLNSLTYCSCKFEYKDAGELCIASFQCGGKCTGEIGIGTCSKYPKGCSRYTEILLGLPNHIRCVK